MHSQYTLSNFLRRSLTLKIPIGLPFDFLLLLERNKSCNKYTTLKCIQTFQDSQHFIILDRYSLPFPSLSRNTGPQHMYPIKVDNTSYKRHLQPNISLSSACTAHFSYTALTDNIFNLLFVRSSILFLLFFFFFVFRSPNAFLF